MMWKKLHNTVTTIRSRKLVITLLLVVAGGLLLTGIISARAHEAPAPIIQESSFHPTFAMLDEEGNHVLESGKPVSTMKTCGQCHDTEYIESHSYHADVGLSDFVPSDTSMGSSPGLFGRWDPLPYRYLSQEGDERLDLSTAEWLMTLGLRHSGGGPATTSRGGVPLQNLQPSSQNPETSILNPQTGESNVWDWNQSGVIEMNCFLCHLAQPANDARIEAIKSGQFGWANTATLLNIGIVKQTESGWVWNESAFDETGQLRKNYVAIQDPDNENCALCHGVVQTDLTQPLVLEACTWETSTTGQIISPEKISESGMNILNKEELAHAWDIHAERQLKCTDCHFSLNNPAQIQKSTEEKPAHLVYDPRKLEIDEYLERPNHNFARGQSAQYTIEPDLKGTMRRCETCHDAEPGHADWLPYLDRHMDVLACESCHIPQMHSAAIEYYDWTVLTPQASAANSCRGMEYAAPSVTGEPMTVSNLVTGFEPVLLMRQNVDGDRLLAPYNLVTSWYWVYEDANNNIRPVRQIDLQAAWFEDGSYAAEVMAVFDANQDGSLDSQELRIDTDEKESVIASRLQALGLRNPRIEGRIQPYSINHDVVDGDWAIRDCQTCHHDDSRIKQPFKLAGYIPGGVMPAFVEDSNVLSQGELFVDDNGALYFKPETDEENLYVFGSDRVPWVDWFGAVLFVGVLLGVAGHGTLRYVATLKRPRAEHQLKKVYMYTAYERFWHWLQTLTIVFLLFTGLVIHRPDIFGAFSFRYIVLIHNILAAILVINAALSLFYHLASGEIKQFIPRPRGFFDQAITQAMFYIKGIFRGEPHPFEKTPQKKLNPLQQVTYFGLLNVLLPLQVITGALMWGVQQWPGIAQALGGLPFLAPFHSLIAWSLAAFVVMHVYLTTTGPTPLTDIRAMITGWDEVEVVHQGEKPSTQTATEAAD